MKKAYILAMALAVAGATYAQRGNTPPEDLSNKYGFRMESRQHLHRVSDGKIVPMAEETVYDILGCKQGSVYGNEYTENTAWTGSACADAGRPGLAMGYFQYFDDCLYKFNEVRFLGFFNYFDEEEYSWYYCNSRGAMDDEMNMTEPVTFEIGIYEENEDGLPGKCVMRKDMEILGERTRVSLDSYGGPSTYIYEFSAPLGEDIDLEHGFIQINAKDMGDSPSCWFAVFTVGGLKAYQMDIANETYTGQQSCAFCLYGDGTRNCTKGLQLERFLTPKSTATGRYERVQVELNNIGTEDVSDARLELYVDGKLVATEDVDATIQSTENGNSSNNNVNLYKYTFKTRVNCVAGAEIMVKNVTPGDEMKAHQTLSMTVEPDVAGEYPELEAYVPNVINITNVTLGDDINNTTEGSTYSDFTALESVFTPGTTKKLSVTVKTNDYEPSLGVYIDWNGDYKFSSDEAVVFDSFDANDNGAQAEATITLPENAAIGKHRMRVVAVPYYYDPDPAYEYGYYYAEIEDYTISVEAAATDPIMTVDKSMIELEVRDQSVDDAITLENNGNGVLSATIDCKYILPGSPTGNYAAKVAPKTGFNGRLSTKGVKRTAQQKAPAAVANTKYVLKYDSDVYSCIGIGNAAKATFANLYPGAMLSNIAGMKISSVDVYVGDVAETTSIVVYGAKTQTENGELIASKEFTPTAYAWNHVELDEPVEIGNNDIWVGVEMLNISANGYYIGYDEGPATVGFGDIVNIGGSTWWSMSDLGIDGNYCIRANVTGEPTPAISWLTVDKQTALAAANSNETLTVTLNPEGLADGVYEAFVEISSNDPLNKFVRVPVYMAKGIPTAISAPTKGTPGIVLNGTTLTVSSAKTIAAVRVNDTAGRSIMNMPAAGTSATIDLAQCAKGIVIVTVVHNDGTATSVKVPVMK